MDPIKADCRTDYMPASRTSGTRPLSAIKWVVLHDTEGGSAYTNARYFHNPAPPPPKGDGPTGSAHLVVDDNRCYRCLPNTAVPWGAPGANLNGFHIEQCGFAAWTRNGWLLHSAMVRRAAYKTAYHCHLFKLPVAFLVAEDLKAGEKGITTHFEVSKAFGGDHTDPGPFWPRDYFMQWVRTYYKALGGL